MVCKVDIVQTVLEHVLLLKNITSMCQIFGSMNLEIWTIVKQLKTRYVFFLIFCQYLNFSVTIKARSAFK